MNKLIKIAFGVVGGIVLLISIDLICIFKINKPLFAIKDKNGYVYRGLFYDTYNCLEYSMPQIKLKGTKLACAPNISEEIEESIYMPTEIGNVSISISDISITGATIKIKDTNKNQYTYGEWYKLEKEMNGKWYELKTKVKDYGFNEVGHIPDKNNEVKFVIDWENIYGKLPLGSYRILKQVNNQYISIEFGIATTSSSKIEVKKSEVVNLNRFNKYLERDNITIYLSGNIDEVYYTSSEGKYKLKDYIGRTWQTTNDGIKHLTDEMELIDTLKDGGTKIYKSKEYDITIIKCNTISGNKKIYIGDYLIDFNSDSMCK